MRLQSARVLNYKSVLDSETFSIRDLTCLVGKNESGKTALLEALEKLKSVQPTRAVFSAATDYPRMHLSDYEASGQVATPIVSTWELSTAEAEAIESLAGAKVLKSREVILSKNYDIKLTWKIGLDLSPAIKALIESVPALDAKGMITIGNPLTTTDLKKVIDAAEETPGLSSLKDAFNSRFPSGSLTSQVQLYLEERLPLFVYYSSYDRLPGQVSLDQLLANPQSDPGYKVFVALLSMVDTTPVQISTITSSEALIAKLEGVENRISSKIFQYWTQNTNLSVRFLFNEAAPSDPPPFNTGKVFRTRIRNNRHGVSIALDERSAGFIWFFSFLVWFSEVQKTYGDNLIVLLDEPGLSLHARAQGDLLRYIKAELLSKYQVLYTTHSPFMIDSRDLLSCRTVEDATAPSGEILGTKVGDDVLSTDSDTLFPLQAALGYDVTQSLFIGENCLLVEGPSEVLYLPWFSAQLIARGRSGLDSRWTVVPCGGITKVAAFMTLFGGNKLHVAVLTDYAHGEKRAVKELRESALLREGHVLTADMYAPGQAEADTEDMIGRVMYRELVNRTYSLKGAKAVAAKRPADAPERVVKEVEDHFKLLAPTDPEFDHYAPARWLFESTDGASLPGLDDALDRFEQLFQALNALLP